MNDTSPPRELEVVIVGAGFGGLCMGIRLLKAGIRDFLVLEKGHEVGGTWRDNTYPGAACDVPSHLYSYSFDGSRTGRRRYAGWERSSATSCDTTERHGMLQYVQFGEQVESAHFDTTSGRWRVGTKSGDRASARHLVLATGPLHGRRSRASPDSSRSGARYSTRRAGTTATTSRGKRVASIGTGGSAIQYFPEIAPEVASCTSSSARRHG